MNKKSASSNSDFYTIVSEVYESKEIINSDSLDSLVRLCTYYTKKSAMKKSYTFEMCVIFSFRNHHSFDSYMFCIFLF